VSGEYVIGAPLLAQATLAVGNGKRFIMRAKHLSQTHRYIASATLNGKALMQPIIRYEEIMEGGVLEFVMSDTPSALWKTKD
jgi:putative alpha-1,2-mannosidase